MYFNIIFRLLYISIISLSITGCGSGAYQNNGDDIAPVITLKGKNPLYLSQGGSLVDPGATALDREDGDITTSIVTKNDINSSKIGSYTIFYDVNDSAGHSAIRVVRTVIVRDANPPKITLNAYKCSDINWVISQYNSYKESGAEAIDDIDGNLTSSIIITVSGGSNLNFVDTSTSGTYNVTYNVKDSAGNSAIPKTRVIKVISASTKKSGQIVSYDENGNIVSGCSIKDDGYYQIGSIISYSKKILPDGNITITDHTTGLKWSDGAPVRKNWNDANSYCNALGLDGLTWRLPQMWELLSIVKKGKIGKASAIEDIFQRPVSEKADNRAYAWTKTDAPSSKHWTIRINFGGTDVYDEDSEELIYCVSGTATKIAIAPTDRVFTRDATTQIVSEAKSNLDWSDDNSILSQKITWEESIAYCDGLTLGGYSDWRLPNINEWYTLSTYDNSASQYPNVFVNIVNGEKYWSSTTTEFQPLFTITTTYDYNEVWLYRPSVGADSTSSSEKSKSRNTICVRNR